MRKLGVTTTELQTGLSSSDTKELTNRLYLWLVQGCELDLSSMQFNYPTVNTVSKKVKSEIQSNATVNTVSEEIKSEIRAEQRKIGVHISDIELNNEQFTNVDEIQIDLDYYLQRKAERKQRGCSWSSSELD